MRAALVLGVVATLALSAGAAQEAVYPRHGYAPHGYGYAYGYHHRHYGYHHRHARYRYSESLRQRRFASTSAAFH